VARPQPSVIKQSIAIELDKDDPAKSVGVILQHPQNLVVPIVQRELEKLDKSELAKLATYNEIPVNLLDTKEKIILSLLSTVPKPIVNIPEDEEKKIKSLSAILQKPQKLAIPILRKTLETLSRNDLKKLTVEQGIPLYGSPTKDELIVDLLLSLVVPQPLIEAPLIETPLIEAPLTGEEKDTALEELAQKFGYKVVQVPKDGNCQFNAISASLKLTGGAQFKSYNHQKLRSMAVKYLKRVDDIVQLYLPAVRPDLPTDSPEQLHKSIKKYLKQLEMDGTWGDSISLLTLSEIFKVKFNLLMLNTKNFQFVSNDDSFTTIIPLGFIDDYHYTALEKLPKKIIGQPIPIQPRTPPTPQPRTPPTPQPRTPPTPQPRTPPTPQPRTPPIQPRMPLAQIEPSRMPLTQIESPIMPPTQIEPSRTLYIEPPVFKPVKPVASVNDLLKIMDTVKPYIYDDIAQLEKANQQIMVSLGM
jgi:hypothetical protein